MLLTKNMTNEQMEGEIEQHTEWLKIHDRDISELREKGKMLAKYCESLEVAGFMPTNHGAAGDEARKLMAALIRDLKEM